MKGKLYTFCYYTLCTTLDFLESFYILGFTTNTVSTMKSRHPFPTRKLLTRPR